MKTIHLPSLNSLPKVVEQLLEEIKGYRLLLFYGEMGVGKTTFIKEFCRQLGVTGNVTSPTFSIVNEYSSDAGPIYHFDFYRLKEASEALDLGYEEYFYSGNFCFVEWPEKIEGLLPEESVAVSLVLAEEKGRIVTVELPPTHL